MVKRHKKKIKHSYRNCYDYLTNENPNSDALSPTDKEEVKFICFLDIKKSNGLYSSPNELLKLL